MTENLDTILATVRERIVEHREQAREALAGSRIDSVAGMEVVTTIVPMPTRGSRLRFCVETGFREREES